MPDENYYVVLVEYKSDPADADDDLNTAVWESCWSWIQADNFILDNYYLIEKEYGDCLYDIKIIEYECKGAVYSMREEEEEEYD